MAGLEVKRRAYRRGLHGEWLAALALTCKGYRILARRYRTRNGEIDLIARRGRIVVMVEVKCRANLREAMDAVGLTAQRRIEAAAGQWLQNRPDCLNCAIRFDLIAILPWRWPVHVERAWEGR